ncbi:hypothetical protein Dimus_019910, partial [Dionaea muscipula]
MLRVPYEIFGRTKPQGGWFYLLFFKKSWGIIGRDITEVVLEFFSSGRMLKSINTTVVHLVAKVPNPSR